jgi:membrane associated rhomboid family serine protease
VFPLKDNIPTDRFPVVTVALIAINVFVYFFLQHGGWTAGHDEQVTKYGAIPYELTHPGDRCGYGNGVTPDGTLVETESNGVVGCEGKAVATTGGDIVVQKVPGPGPASWLTVLTSMFMHGGILHLAGNMLFLWIFGNNIEDAMGPLRFIVFYLLAGVAALAGQVLIDPSSISPTIGASGAIAGVLGGYILIYPWAKVLAIVILIVLVVPVEVPAWVMLGLWFLLQVFYGTSDLSDPTGGGVAYFAHIGGFVFGLAAIKLFAKRIKPREPALPVY